MKKLLTIALACVFLAGCATTQITSGLNKFVTNVEAVNASIEKYSAILAKNCATAQNYATALQSRVNASSTAGASLDAANAGIVAWCQSPPSDILSAIKASAAMAEAANQAYKAAKAGN